MFAARVSIERFSAVLSSPLVLLQDVRLLSTMLRCMVDEQAPMTPLRLAYEAQMTGKQVAESLQVLVGTRIVREREGQYWLNRSYVHFPRKRPDVGDRAEDRRYRREEAQERLRTLAGK